jgi:hypothetical protein
MKKGGARISRTSRREHPKARAISRTPRHSASRRLISAYRSTINFLRPMTLSRSCLSTTAQGLIPQKRARHGWVQSDEIGWVHSH